MQVALNGFAGSFLLVWLYGRLRLFWPAARREAGLVPFALFLLLTSYVGASPLLMDHGLLLASGLVVAWGMLLEATGRGSSTHMLLGDLLGVAVLVSLGLEVPFLTDPSGGYIYLHSLAGPATCLWLIAFVALLKLANRLPGLFTGVMALLTYLLMGSLLYQQQHPVVDFRVLSLVAGISTAMWLNGLGGASQRMGRIAASLWALTLAALTVLSSSKKVATLAVLSPVGLGLAPLFFFSFVILRSYFWPKIATGFDRPPVLRLNLSRERVVGVLLLFCLLTDLLLLMWLFVPSKMWSLGLALAMAVVFLEVVQLVLLAPPTEDLQAPPRHIDLLGIPIRRRSVEEHLDLVRGWLSTSRPHLVATPDSLAILRAQDDEEYRGLLQGADSLLPDGAGVIWATDFLHGGPVLERIPGVEFVQHLCRLAADEGAGVFLLGTRDEILDAARERLEERFPGLEVVGTQHGFFAEDESPEVAARIRKSGAAICLVAMGVPKQERWIREWGEASGARVLMGVGGSLDVLSGTLPRAPERYQALGIEWLYRLLLEPKRLSKMLHLPRFVLKVLEAKLERA